MSSLFGGSEKIEILTPAQQGLLNDLTKQIRANIGESGPVYEGQVTAELSPLQRMGLDQAGRLGAGIPGVDSAIADMVAGRGAIDFDADRYYTDAVYNPAKQAFDDELRQIEARYGASGGGGFADALGQGAARFGTNIGSMMADLAREERGLADARRAGGLTAAFGRNADIASTSANLLGPIGGVQRGVQSEMNLEALNKWNAGQAYNNPWLGFVGPALGTSAYAVGQQQGMLPGIAGAVGGLLGGASAFF